MTMKTYRFALIPQRRRQSLYRDYKKPVEHFLRVLLKEVGARPQRLEENNDHVYIRVLMPEGVNAQRAIAWVKRESAAALYARLKRTGCDVISRIFGLHPITWTRRKAKATGGTW